jgi:hypothetical protein
MGEENAGGHDRPPACDAAQLSITWTGRAPPREAAEAGGPLFLWSSSRLSPEEGAVLQSDRSHLNLGGSPRLWQPRALPATNTPSRPAACRDPRTDPRARFGSSYQPRLSVQAPRRGARPADPGPPSAAQRRRSVSLQMVPGRLDRGDRGLGSARRCALARAAVDRAGGPLRRARLPRRVRGAILRLSPRTPAMGRRDDHRGRAGGHRTDRRRRQRPPARLPGRR